MVFDLGARPFTQSVGGTSLQGVATDWIEYGGSRIEFPLANLAYRCVYDQSKDQILVFRIELAALVAP